MAEIDTRRLTMPTSADLEATSLKHETQTRNMTQRTIEFTWMKVEYQGPVDPSPGQQATLKTYVNINGGEWKKARQVTRGAIDLLNLFGNFAKHGESRVAEFNSNTTQRHET